MEFQYQVGNEIKTVKVERRRERFQVTVNGRVYDVAANRLEPDQFYLEIDGQQRSIHVAREDRRWYVGLAGETWMLARPQAQPHRHGADVDAGGGLAAPMPGQVIEVLIGEGDEVVRGQVLVLLEAMKMELQIVAPGAGRIRRLNCAAGQVVERGQVLVEIEGEA